MVTEKESKTKTKPKKEKLITWIRPTGSEILVADTVGNLEAATLAGWKRKK